MQKPLVALIFLACLCSMSCWAQSESSSTVVPLVAPIVANSENGERTSPVGLWNTINESGQEQSQVRITEKDGQLSGVIEKILPPGLAEAKKRGDAIPICRKCEGDLKDNPIEGMTIINGLKKDGDTYDGGTILDPNNGKVYKCKLHVTDDGKSLEVRGFIGISLFGRSQTWKRVQ